MSTLLISTFPPERCGVAAYAAQSVAAIRAEGGKVRVLTWGEGSGDIHLSEVPTGKRVLEFLRHVDGSGPVIMHYMPSFYLDKSSRMAEVQSRLALTRVFREISALEVVVHELPWYPPVEQLSAPGKLLWWLERRQWLAATDLCFHNQAAVETYRQRYRVPGTNARVVEHGRDFQPQYRGSRSEARADLGLAPGDAVFVSVGFITAYKGYELMLEAMAQRPTLPCRYVVVGEPHPRGGEADRAYLTDLQGRAYGDPRIHFQVEYVDDIAFDRWVCAADAVVLPYRSSTSSSVLARCHLLGTPAVVSEAAGLRAELGARDRSVKDGADLARVLEELVAHAIATGSPLTSRRRL